MSTFFPGLPANVAGGGVGILIEERVLESGTPVIRFENIPQTYRDLTFRLRGKTFASGLSVDIHMRFNDDDGANYDYTVNQAHGNTGEQFGAIAATSAIIGKCGATSSTVNYRDAIECTIFDYRGNMRKICQSKCSYQEAIAVPEDFYVQNSAQWWRLLEPVSVIEIFPPADGFIIGTVVSLYGIT